MYHKKFLFIMVSLVVLALLASPVFSKSITIKIKGSDIQSYSLSEAALENLYVMSFTVHEDVIGKRLDTVLLEFYVDASLKNSEDVAHSPVIEIYPLSQAFDGRETPQFAAFSSTVRNVSLGSGKRVIGNITDIVKEWIANPSSNHGLIVGSLTGLKDGKFSIRTDIIKGGIGAKVKFYYQNRFGGRVSQ